MTNAPPWLLLDGPASYAVRLCEWTPAPRPGEGLLVIRLWKTTGGREDADVYAVEEQTRDAGGRIFLLLNASDANQEQPYEVRVGRATGCTCKGARTRRGQGCKHYYALSKLISEGLL